MKIEQMKNTLNAFAKMHKKAGDNEAAKALNTFANLLDGHESSTVSAFANRIIKAKNRK